MQGWPASEGTVSRVLRIGFEVRLTVLTDDGEVVTAEMARTQARALGVTEGSTVWLSSAVGAATVPALRPQVAAV